VSAALLLKPGTILFGKNSNNLNSAPINDPGVRSYHREMFEPYVGDTFRVRLGKQVVDLKLVALTDVKPVSGVTNGKSACTDCFSMKFHTNTYLPDPETIHTLNHSKLGDFDLFMVQSEEGTRFFQTAIINHVR
jgi:hypothetical protein